MLKICYQELFSIWEKSHQLLKRICSHHQLNSHLSQEKNNHFYHQLHLLKFWYLCTELMMKVQIDRFLLFLNIWLLMFYEKYSWHLFILFIFYYGKHRGIWMIIENKNEYLSIKSTKYRFLKFFSMTNFSIK